MLLPPLALALTSFIKLSLAQTQGSADLHIGPIAFAGYDNYVYRNEVTNVQAVVSRNTSTPDSDPARLIFAFPRGNSGVCSFFSPLSGVLATTLDNTSFAAVTGDNNQTGFSAQLRLSADTQLGETFIGSVRTIRDYVEGNGTRHEIFNYTLGDYNSSSVQLVRNWINGTTVQYLTYSAVDNLNITVVPNQNATLPPNVTMTRPDQSRNGSLLVTTTFNYTTSPDLVGLSSSQLFLNSTPAGAESGLLETVIDAIQGPGQSTANQTAFLSYQDVFFAGGWRFLTYFGRDTLLTLRLLLPVLTPEAAEGIMRAVLSRTRLNVTAGQLCHEETIGDYASFVNIQNNQSYLGDTPSYNYVMLDTDFLLLPVLADYFLTSPQGRNRSRAFLEEESSLNPGTLQSLLQINVDHVLNLTRPFAEEASANNLLRIRDQLVGNWRDSGTGLGYGQVPFDVNVAFVPAALRAIASLSDAGILPSNYSNASSAASVWEASSYQFFEVEIDSATATSRLQNYVQQAGLSSSTVQGGGVLNETGSTGGLYENTTQTIGGSQGNSTFYALSLYDSNNTAIEVLNSDLGFVLEYSGNVSSSIIRATIEALQPYPKGLLTNVGMVVANAAYDSNTTNIQTFDNAQYHGAVVWSWQQGIMAQGIGRQLALCGLSNSTLAAPPANASRPAWCSDDSLTSGLEAAQTRLWDSISGSESVLYTEVWSPVFSNGTFTIGDLGAISPTGTEGDAIQFWSYGFLGLVDPRTGRPVAAGL